MTAKKEYEKVIHSFLTDISKEKKIPIDRLMVGEIGNDLYVWDFDSGRSQQDQFKVVLIIRGDYKQSCQ